MEKSNISLIINCQKEDINTIDISHFNDKYTRVYFNIKPESKEYLNKILTDIETEYYSIWDFDQNYRNIYNLNIYCVNPKNIDISILIPVYNCENYINECIDSCLDQDFIGNYEIIIVDDGSTDNTINLIQEYSDNRIKLYLKPHSGISDTLNYGISKCNGKYICRMDGDDVMYKNRLSLQYKYMQRHPETDILSNGLICFNDKLESILHNIKINNFDKHKIQLKDICNELHIHHPCVFFKNLLDGFYYNRDFDGYEDYELWFRLLKYYNYNIDSWHIPVLKYRFRDKSNSHNINLQPNIDKLKAYIKNECNKTIGIYYIGTGIYINNFNSFLESIKNFFPNNHKIIILLSDTTEKYDTLSTDNITIKQYTIEDHPWPIVALFRFHYLLKYKIDTDYVFFFNSNSIIQPNKLVSWFNETKINVTKHFTYRSGIKTTYELLLPSDDNPNSTSYIGNIEYTYCQSGFFGGPSNLVYKMCEDIVKMINIDLNNNIIAKWHDETYFNKWLYDKNYDETIINITDVFYNKNFKQEQKSNFIYLEYKEETDFDYNKKKKLENKIHYKEFKPEHNYDKDKNMLNII